MGWRMREVEGGEMWVGWREEEGGWGGRRREVEGGGKWVGWRKG